MNIRSLSIGIPKTGISTRVFNSMFNSREMSPSNNPSRNLSPSVLQNKNNFDSYIKKFHRFKKQSKLTIKNSFLFNVNNSKQKSFLLNNSKNQGNSNNNCDYISNFLSSFKRREIAKNDENKICTSITAMKQEILFSDPNKNSVKKDFIIPKKVAQDLMSKIKKLSPKKLTNNLLASSKKNLSININNKNYNSNNNTLKKHNSCINFFDSKSKSRTMNRSSFNPISNNTFSGGNAYTMQRSASVPNYFTTSNSIKPTSPNNSMIRSNSICENKPYKRETLTQKIENMRSNSVLFSRSFTPNNARNNKNDNFFNENKISNRSSSRPISARKDKSGKLFELTGDKLFPLYSGSSTNFRTFNKF